MQVIEFNGEAYNDDRMFVLYITKCTVATVDVDTLATTIHHDDAPDKYQWCVVTYRNVARYPAVRVDHFDSFDVARGYVRKVEPTVPLISLGGSSPRTPLPYERFVEWKTQNGFAEYDYKRMYSEGGGNPKELIFSKRR